MFVFCVSCHFSNICLILFQIPRPVKFSTCVITWPFLMCCTSLSLSLFIYLSFIPLPFCAKLSSPLCEHQTFLCVVFVSFCDSLLCIGLAWLNFLPEAEFALWVQSSSVPDNLAITWTLWTPVHVGHQALGKRKEQLNSLRQEVNLHQVNLQPAFRAQINFLVDQVWKFSTLTLLISHVCSTEKLQ